MCTLPISCPMVQNVRSRNFYGHSCLALCTNSIKCLRSIKRNTSLFTKHVSHPSGQNASAFAGRDGGRSRLGAGALDSLDVAILARQLSVTPSEKWHPHPSHPSHPSHRLNQLQLASQALLHDGPGRLEAVEIGAYFYGPAEQTCSHWKSTYSILFSLEIPLRTQCSRGMINTIFQTTYLLVMLCDLQSCQGASHSSTQSRPAEADVKHELQE